LEHFEPDKRCKRDGDEGKKLDVRDQAVTKLVSPAPAGLFFGQ
jgi:hypothetical protein